MKKLERQLIWSLLITSYICLLITSYICLLVVVAGFSQLLPKNQGYQEECVQSHVEVTSTIIKANMNIDNIVVYSQGSPIKINTTKMNKGDIQEIFAEQEVCDKYALVRYVEETK